MWAASRARFHCGSLRSREHAQTGLLYLQKRFAHHFQLCDLVCRSTASSLESQLKELLSGRSN